jgi:hypothetical protein
MIRKVGGWLVKCLKARQLSVAEWRKDADAFASTCKETREESTPTKPYGTENAIRSYFEGNLHGPGIWKWEHYFDIYHKHFQKFVGGDVTVLEIGIYSGGSLGMWRSYFGDRCTVIGVDIQESCRVYENSFTRVHIGDQGDREFWRGLMQEVARPDVIIDDGGHLPEQQRVTLEETFAKLKPGGVYLCEDVHGSNNLFAAFTARLAENLHSKNRVAGDVAVSEATELQRWVKSVSFYPFCVVIEKNDFGVTRFNAPRRGTEWQPFLSRDR